MPGLPRVAAAGGGSHHLGEHVTAYADRRLDPASLHAFDRHLVTCPGCRGALEQERRVLEAMRAGPVVSAGLQASLLSLAAPRLDVGGPAGPTRGPADADGGIDTAAVGGSRLRTMPVSAPAAHLSPVRAIVIAGLSVGASAAAAVALSVGGAGAVAATPGGSSGPATGTATTASSSAGSAASSAGSAAALVAPAALLEPRPAAPARAATAVPGQPVTLVHPAVTAAGVGRDYGVHAAWALRG